MKKRNKKLRFRFDIVLICSLFVLLISFCAYMINTTLETVLENETGKKVITHDFTYDNSDS